MAPHRLAYETHGSRTVGSDSIVEGLRSSNCEFISDPRRADALLLFVESFRTDLPARIHDLADTGADHILVVAPTPQALDVGQVWQLRRAGATDVMCASPGHEVVPQILERIGRWKHVEGILSSRDVRDTLVGNSTAWRRVLRQVIEVSVFSDTPVLLQGETGTGKECLARLVHRLTDRASDGELVIVDCTTIVPELSGSEFFGHERGAFTGADSRREGAFALANGGTLLLDEVSELPQVLQAQLLRVVQEGTYKRVGGNVWHRTSFRLVSATNRDLVDAVRAGRFRQDLFYRLAGAVVRIPPLKERVGDVLPLARHFLSRSTDRECALDPSVRDLLVLRSYDGNVRELRQLVSRLLLRHPGSGPLTIGAVPAEEIPGDGGESGDWQDGALDACVAQAVRRGVPLRDIGRAATEAAIRQALDLERGNVRRAASRLKVTPRALQLRRASCRGASKPDSPGRPGE